MYVQILETLPKFTIFYSMENKAIRVFSNSTLFVLWANLLIFLSQLNHNSHYLSSSFTVAHL